MSAPLRGTPAAPGAAIAPIWRPPAPTEAGVAPAMPLAEAAGRAAAELEELASRVHQRGMPDEAAILAAQAMMAADPGLLGPAQERVGLGEAADLAILGAGEAAAEMLASLDDELLASRAADVRDVAARIARVLRGETPPRLERRSIAIAVDLPPSLTAELDPSLLAGMALEAGSRTAHAAILARALAIPAVVGCAGLLAAAQGATQVAIDGDSGEVILDPDAATMAEFERRATSASERVQAGEALRDVPLQTKDGHRVMLGANIGRPEDAAAALQAGAEGVGLFRTEFMFMGRVTAPDEAAQVSAYAAVLRAFGERPVVFRMIDLGADKQLPYLPLPAEENPFLGMRALRLADAGHEQVLVTQLRAILLAGDETGHAPWIMAPMVGDLADVYRMHELMALAAFGRTVATKPTVGIMVEVPAATVLADRIAQEVAFFSIGTNDLTQYTLAADRTNPALTDRQDPLHPAVLRSIAATIDAGHAAGIPVAVCGEMAGDPAGAVALVGLGIDELSMDPVSFAAVKRAVSGVTLADARAAAKSAMQAERASDGRAQIDALIAGGPQEAR